MSDGLRTPVRVMSIDEMADRIEELEAENHLLKTSGIIEVSAHNNRVTEYMFHWEGRALDAEAKLAKCEARLMKAVEALSFLEIAATGAGVLHPKEREVLHDCIRKARATLAELKGQDDE